MWVKAPAGSLPSRGVLGGSESCGRRRVGGGKGGMLACEWVFDGMSSMPCGSHHAATRGRSHALPCEECFCYKPVQGLAHVVAIRGNLVYCFMPPFEANFVYRGTGREGMGVKRTGTIGAGCEVGTTSRI